MKQEALHGRQRQLLALLRAQPRVVTRKELAAQLDVSDRTVGTDIQALNRVLAHYGAGIEAIRGKGLILRMPEDPPPALNALSYLSDTMQTREERANLLLVKLLLADHGLQLGELEDEMFVSRTTLEHDVRYVRKLVTMRRPHLYLSRRDNRISIETTEWNRRLVLTKIFAERWDYQSKEGIFPEDIPLLSETFQRILTITKDTVRSSLIKLDDYDLVALAFTIAIAEFRIRTGHPLGTPPAGASGAAELSGAVDRLMDQIEAALRTAFDASERAGILLSFSFRVSPLRRAEAAQVFPQFTDKKAMAVTELFLGELRDKFGAGFDCDRQLYMELAIHTARLEKRMRYSYERRNPLLPVLKTRYIYFFELSMVIRPCFRAVYGIDIWEDEWGYFAGLLIASFHRILSQRFPNGLPTTLVSHLGRSDQEMLASQLRATYGGSLDLRGPYSIYEKEQILASRPQIILSTVRLEVVRPELAHIPHLTVPAIFGGESFLRLNQLLCQAREALFFHKLPRPFSSYFEPALFFTGLDLASEQEVITYLTHRIAGLGYATIECMARALDREEWSSTAMEDGIALPRVRVLGPCKSVIAAALLKRPIHWGGQRVSLVFFTAVAEGELPTFAPLLHTLANGLCRKGNRKKLIQMRTYEDLAALL